MFGFSKKRKPANALEAFIFAVYGNPPPAKRADIAKAVALASSELLMGIVDQREIQKQAATLYACPIPYSTHDLALSVALCFFKMPEYIPSLTIAQMGARMKAMQWSKEGLVVQPLVTDFGEILYKLYKPVF